MTISTITKSTLLSSSAKYAPAFPGVPATPGSTSTSCFWVDVPTPVFPGSSWLIPIPKWVCFTSSTKATPAIPPRPARVYDFSATVDANLGWNAGARTVSEFNSGFLYSFGFGTGTISTYIGLNAGIDSSTLPTETPISIRNDRGVALLTYPGGTINLGYVTNSEESNYFEFTRDDNDFVSLKYYKDGMMVDAESAPMTPWTYKYSGTVHLETSIYSGRDYIRLYDEYGIKKISATLSSTSSLYLDPTIANTRIFVSTTVLAGAGIGAIVKYLRSTIRSEISIYAALHSAARLSTAISSTTTIFARLAEGAHTTLPSIKTFAADRSLASAYTSLPALTTRIIVSIPMPSVTIGISSLAYLLGIGTGLTGEIATGAVTLPALRGGASADFAYAFGETILPALTGYAALVDAPGEASFYTRAPSAITPYATADMTVTSSSSFTLDGEISALREFYDTIITSIDTAVMPAVILVTEGRAISSISVYITEGTDVGSDWYSWVVNYETNAHWRYDNFQFNSFCKFNGKTYGCKEDGIYELSGNTDDGTNIESKVTTSVTDFDNALKKRMLKAYLGIKSDGDMVLKVLAEGGNVYYYGIDNTRSSVGGTRVNIGRGLTSRYWQFELLNSNGSDFELDAIEFFPVITSRREM